jgi:hypothetical protein
VLADLHIDFRERPAGLEVHSDIGTGLDVSSARDGGLDDALGSRHHLRRGSRRAGRRPDLGHRENHDGGSENAEEIQVPRSGQSLAHGVPSDVVLSVTSPVVDDDLTTLWTAVLSDGRVQPETLLSPRGAATGG